MVSIEMEKERRESEEERREGCIHERF